MSRWKRQQRRRARRRREDDQSAKAFGDYLAEWVVKFEATCKAFGKAMVDVAGQFAKWGASRRMQEALDPGETERECL